MTYPFEKSKKEYEEIKASDALRSKVMETIGSTYAHEGLEEKSEAIVKGTLYSPGVESHHQKRHYWRGMIATAVALAIALTAGLNMSSDFAEVVAKMPGLEGMVKVLTFGRYEVKDSGFEAKIETPRIEGLVDKKLESELNASFKTYSNEVIRAFEKDLAELKEEFPGQEVHYGVDSGYEVLADNQDYFVIDLWQVNTAGSATEFHRFYTVDKRTEELVTLESLFKDGADYATALEKHILKEMRRQMDAEEGMYWLDDPGMMPERLITDKTLFYINGDGNLVIAFEEYSVAPGSSGTPEFVIPKDVLVMFNE